MSGNLHSGWDCFSFGFGIEPLLVEGRWESTLEHNSNHQLEGSWIGTLIAVVEAAFQPLLRQEKTCYLHPTKHEQYQSN